MKINEIAKDIHANNVSKGFYDKPVEFGTKLMLVTSELSEALEADRKGRNAETYYIDEMIAAGYNWDNSPKEFISAFKDGVKDTVQDEIADAIIRLLDLSECMGFDMEFHIKHKMEYNKLREAMHGKKY